MQAKPEVKRSFSYPERFHSRFCTPSLITDRFTSGFIRLNNNGAYN
jgi:hypothetical protein